MKALDLNERRFRGLSNSLEIFDSSDGDLTAEAGEGFARSIVEEEKKSQSVKSDSRASPFNSLEMILFADVISSGNLDGVTAGLIVKDRYGAFVPALMSGYGSSHHALQSHQSHDFGNSHLQLPRGIKPIHQLRMSLGYYPAQNAAAHQDYASERGYARAGVQQDSLGIEGGVAYNLNSASNYYSGSDSMYTLSKQLPLPAFSEHAMAQMFYAENNHVTSQVQSVVYNVVPVLLADMPKTGSHDISVSVPAQKAGLDYKLVLHENFGIQYALKDFGNHVPAYHAQNVGDNQKVEESRRDMPRFDNSNQPTEVRDISSLANAVNVPVNNSQMPNLHGYKQLDAQQIVPLPYRDEKSQDVVKAEIPLVSINYADGNIKIGNQDRLTQSISPQLYVLEQSIYVPALSIDLKPAEAYHVQNQQQEAVQYNLRDNLPLESQQGQQKSEKSSEPLYVQPEQAIYQKEVPYRSDERRLDVRRREDERKPYEYRRENRKLDDVVAQTRIVEILVPAINIDASYLAGLSDAQTLAHEPNQLAENNHHNYQTTNAPSVEAVVNVIAEKGLHAYFDDHNVRETFAVNYSQPSFTSSEIQVMPIDYQALQAVALQPVQMTQVIYAGSKTSEPISLQIPTEVLVKTPEIISVLASLVNSANSGYQIAISRDEPKAIAQGNSQPSVHENVSLPASSLDNAVEQLQINRQSPSPSVNIPDYSVPLPERKQVVVFDPTYLRNLEETLMDINVRHGTNLSLTKLFEEAARKPLEFYQRTKADNSYCAATTNLEARTDGRLYNALTNSAIEGIRILYDGRVANAARGRETINMQVYQTLNSILAKEQSVNEYGYANVGAESRNVEKGSILYNVIQGSNGTIVPVLMKYRDTVTEKDNSAVMLVAVNDANYLGKLKELAKEQGLSQQEIAQINISTIEDSLYWSAKLGTGVVVQVREKGRNDFHELEWDSSGSNPLERIAQEGLEYRVVFVGKNFYVPQTESLKVVSIEQKLRDREQKKDLYVPTKKDSGYCGSLDGLELRLDGRLADSSGRVKEGFQSFYRFDVDASESARQGSQSISVGTYRTVNSKTEGNDSVNRFGYEKTGKRALTVEEGTPLYEVLKNSNGKRVAVEIEYKDTVHQNSDGSAIYNKTIMLVAVNDANYLMFLREEAKKQGKDSDYIRNIRIDTVENSMKYSDDLKTGLVVYLKKKGQSNFSEPKFVPDAPTPLIDKIIDPYNIMEAFITSAYYHEKPVAQSGMKKAA